jgi:anaphase-promoting complex subunit 3
MDQSKYTDAERVWKELRECEPNRLEGMDYYSSCLQLLKKPVDLTHLANSCLSISHTAPESWIAAGNCFSLAKEIENALKFFNRAIMIRSDYGYAHTLCGHEYV